MNVSVMLLGCPGKTDRVFFDLVMTVHADAVVMLLSEEVTFSADGNIFSGNGDIQAFEFDVLEKIKVFTIGGGKREEAVARTLMDLIFEFFVAFGLGGCVGESLQPCVFIFKSQVGGGHGRSLVEITGNICETHIIQIIFEQVDGTTAAGAEISEHGYECFRDAGFADGDVFTLAGTVRFQVGAFGAGGKFHVFQALGEFHGVVAVECQADEKDQTAAGEFIDLFLLVPGDDQFHFEKFGGPQSGLDGMLESPSGEYPGNQFIHFPVHG